MLGGSWRRRRRKGYSRRDKTASSFTLDASGGVESLNISRGIQHKASQPHRIYGPKVVRGSGMVTATWYLKADHGSLLSACSEIHKASNPFGSAHARHSRICSFKTAPDGATPPRCPERDFQLLHVELLILKITRLRGDAGRSRCPASRSQPV